MKKIIIWRRKSQQEQTNEIKDEFDEDEIYCKNSQTKKMLKCNQQMSL